VLVVADEVTLTKKELRNLRLFFFMSYYIVSLGNFNKFKFFTCIVQQARLKDKF